MLRCRSVIERAGEYLDHRLPWPARIGVRAHLFMCRNCRRFLRQLRQTASLLRAAPPSIVPPEVEQALVNVFNRRLTQRHQPYSDQS